MGHSSCFRAAVTSCFNQLQNLHFLSLNKPKQKTNKQTNKKKGKKGKEFWKQTQTK